MLPVSHSISCTRQAYGSGLLVYHCGLDEVDECYTAFIVLFIPFVLSAISFVVSRYRLMFVGGQVKPLCGS